MRMPVFTPVSTTRAACLRYSWQAWVTRPVSGGTTEERHTPARSEDVRPALVNKPSNCRPYSSGIRFWSVANRQWFVKVSPSYRPMVRLVFPRSMVRSMVLLYRFYDFCDEVISAELRHQVNTLRPGFDRGNQRHSQFHTNLRTILPGVIHATARDLRDGYPGHLIP